MVLTEERPSVLRDLLSIPHFSAVKPLKLSVYAPYHASHIFSASVVDAILAASDSHILNTYKPRIPQISCSTGRRVAVFTCGSLPRGVLEDILIKQLRWHLVLGGCYTELIQTALQGAQFRL